MSKKICITPTRAIKRGTRRVNYGNGKGHHNDLNVGAKPHLH